MSSSRFPGKVLAPLAGRPIVMHAVLRAREVLPADAVVVVTSTELSDDPLFAYLSAENVPVIRGPLDDVFARFRLALHTSPFEWFFRISADSPLLRPDLMRAMLPHATGTVDLVTNVLRRTFPRGHSLELIRSATFCGIDAARLSAEEHEHVTPFFYHNAERFDIVSFENPEPSDGTNYVVDTVDDLVRLEAWLRAGSTPAPVRSIVREIRASVPR